MNSLDTPEGKLLYIVHEMYKANEITAKKRGYLKGTDGVYRRYDIQCQSDVTREISRI